METTPEKPINDPRRQFVKKITSQIHEVLFSIIPNVPYTAGTYTLLAATGMDHTLSIFIGLIIGWLGKPPKKKSDNI